MVYENKTFTVLYGSQTGNAQDLAERIWRESKRFYFKTRVKALDDCNIPELFDEKCIIFVCSTTGQGEEPDNMKSFWKFLLRKSLPSNSLGDTNFAVFGLGDSNYAKFNFVGKRLYRRLLQLGAKAILPLGLGDDQHDLGYDGAADPWIENLWKNMLHLNPLPIDIDPLPRYRLVLPRWNVTTSLLTNKLSNGHSMYYPIRKSTDFTAVVLENKRLTSSEHFQVSNLPQSEKIRINVEVCTSVDQQIFNLPQTVAASIQKQFLLDRTSPISQQLLVSLKFDYKKIT